MVQADWQADAEKGWQLLSWRGEAQWFAKRPGGKVLGGRLRSLDQLIGTIRNAEALGWNLYLNANATLPTSKIKLSRSDVIRWRYLVVDLDPVADSPVAPPESYLPEGVRVFSGRGYQFWVPIRLPIVASFGITDSPAGAPLRASCGAFDTAVALLYERGMSGYLHTLAPPDGYLVDTTCSDLARVVRCPGSINQKTGMRATIERFPDIGKPLYAQAVMDCARYVPEPPAAVCTELTSLNAALPHLNVRTRTFILNGAGFPGRHTACFAAAKNLHELGIIRDRAYEWLLIGAGKCYKVTNDDEEIWFEPYPLPECEVLRQVQRIYG
jgi:hypothetical protein